MKKYLRGVAAFVGCVLFCVVALESMLWLDDWGRLSRYKTLFEPQVLERTDGFPWLEKEREGQPRLLCAPQTTADRNEFKKFATQYLRDHVGKDHFRGKKGMFRWNRSWNVHVVEIGAYYYLPLTREGKPVSFGPENPRIFFIDSRPLGGMGNRGFFMATQTDGKRLLIDEKSLQSRLAESS
ncbi:MAG: hypothetical protein Q4D98_08345 [Planctomycetia bacterium]|nr:hypothetical protein [Planctomycetia bacterium]